MGNETALDREGVVLVLGDGDGLAVSRGKEGHSAVRNGVKGFIDTLRSDLLVGQFVLVSDRSQSGGGHGDDGEELHNGGVLQRKMKDFKLVG